MVFIEQLLPIAAGADLDSSLSDCRSRGADCQPGVQEVLLSRAVKSKSKEV
jgi:hypothetical protein